MMWQKPTSGRTSSIDVCGEAVLPRIDEAECYQLGRLAPDECELIVRRKEVSSQDMGCDVEGNAAYGLEG